MTASNVCRGCRAGWPLGHDGIHRDPDPRCNGQVLCAYKQPDHDPLASKDHGEAALNFILDERFGDGRPVVKQPESGEVQRYDINMRNCSRGVIAEMAPKDDGRYVFISDFRRLQSALEAAQQRIERLEQQRADLIVTTAERIRGLESLLAERNRQNAAAFAERDELQRDAARYRYLRNQEGLPTPEEFDRMVDADMAMVAEERALR